MATIGSPFKNRENVKYRNSTVVSGVSDIENDLFVSKERETAWV